MCFCGALDSPTRNLYCIPLPLSALQQEPTACVTRVLLWAACRGPGGPRRTQGSHYGSHASRGQHMRRQCHASLPCAKEQGSPGGCSRPPWRLPWRKRYALSPMQPGRGGFGPRGGGKSDGRGSSRRPPPGVSPLSPVRAKPPASSFLQRPHPGILQRRWPRPLGGGGAGPGGGRERGVTQAQVPAPARLRARLCRRAPLKPWAPPRSAALLLTFLLPVTPTSK